MQDPNTGSSLPQGLAENGVEKLKPLGQPFDPNLHEALFEMPSAEQKAGTVGAITKVCLILHLTSVRLRTWFCSEHFQSSDKRHLGCWEMLGMLACISDLHRSFLHPSNQS